MPSHTSKDELQTSWLLSSPSPDQLDKNIFSPRIITRSNAVPTPLVTAATTKFEDTMIEDLIFEPEKLARFWCRILTIAIGMFATQPLERVELIILHRLEGELRGLTIRYNGGG